MLNNKLTYNIISTFNLNVLFVKINNYSHIAFLFLQNHFDMKNIMDAFNFLNRIYYYILFLGRFKAMLESKS